MLSWDDGLQIRRVLDQWKLQVTKEELEKEIEILRSVSEFLRGLGNERYLMVCSDLDISFIKPLESQLDKMR